MTHIWVPLICKCRCTKCGAEGEYEARTPLSDDEFSINVSAIPPPAGACGAFIAELSFELCGGTLERVP